MRVVKCAFCKGSGKDPFNLLSELATCQVCGGRGKVEVKEPAIKCAYCKGSGIHPLGARVTCTVVMAKAWFQLKAPLKNALNVRELEKK